MCNVLIIDDDPDMLGLLKIILKPAGYKVEVSSPTDEIFHRVYNNRPDIVLLDVRMGDHDGRIICRDLKTKWGDELKVILFSARHDLRKSALDCSADDFMEKPFDIDQLIGKIKFHCN
jgi:DNA-binding response OmpR family regulator